MMCSHPLTSHVSSSETMFLSDKMVASADQRNVQPSPMCMPGVLPVSQAALAHPVQTICMMGHLMPHNIACEH